MDGRPFLHLILDQLYVETLDFEIPREVATRAYATTPTMADAFKAVCEHIGLELIDYESGRLVFPGPPFSTVARLELRSRAWNARGNL